MRIRDQAGSRAEDYGNGATRADRNSQVSPRVDSKLDFEPASTEDGRAALQDCRRNWDNARRVSSLHSRGRTCTQTCRSSRPGPREADPCHSIRSWDATRAWRKSRKQKSDPLGRGQCAGEPVLRRWSSPRFIRHSGLADTAHRTDCRVEPLFNECRFNQR